MDSPRKSKSRTARLLEKTRSRPAKTGQAESPARSENELLKDLRTSQVELETQNEALRQSRIALEDSRDRYIKLFEFAPVGYLTLTDKGLIEQINLTGARFLGMDRSRLLSRRFAGFVAAEDRARWSRRFNAMLRSQRGYTDELRLRREDGSEFRVLIDCQSTSIDGTANSVLLTLTGNNERRSMKQRERSFNVIFERSSIGIAVTGSDRRYRQVNPAMCRMLGYSEAELLGMSYLDITHPDDKELKLGKFEPTIAGDVYHFSVEKRYLRKTGETVWVSLNVASVTRESNGEPLYSIVMAEDITERREAELKRLAEARQQRETLVREVHHRIKNNLQGVAGLLQRELGKFVELNPRLEAAISQI
ncbi:MAG: PAS domain S-box protein, partial [Sulfuritalea sp.]|nr:PAS domain S-box protein [Sulfuritalea sp.]